ncbi:MAG: ABC transporter ATP-binding protein [Acidimicrobiia bacterium]|nr:MAG: ABC transporter ATP-binding protein [Acidimicrobiia bacterium]
MSDSQRSRTGGPPAVRVTGLGWRIGGLTIVEGVDLEVGVGEFVSIIGPNGAGKTSLINLISGVHIPTAGSIELFGEDVTRLRPSERVKRGLGRTFQTSSLFPSLTVKENVRLAAQAGLGGSLDLWRRVRDGEPATRIGIGVLERVGLGEHADRVVSDLSHGDKRKLEIAVVMARDPAVLLLDEPTAGVGAEETEGLIGVIRDLHGSGKTVVMIEHRIEFVVDVSERIAVLDQGRLLTCDRPEAVMVDPRVRSAYLGG